MTPRSEFIQGKPYILAAIESPCTTLYRPLIVTFALSSIVSEILPVLYAPRQYLEWQNVAGGGGAEGESAEIETP